MNFHICLGGDVFLVISENVKHVYPHPKLNMNVVILSPIGRILCTHRPARQCCHQFLQILWTSLLRTNRTGRSLWKCDWSGACAFCTLGGAFPTSSPTCCTTSTICCLVRRQQPDPMQTEVCESITHTWTLFSRNMRRASGLHLL